MNEIDISQVNTIMMSVLIGLLILLMSSNDRGDYL
jgi:hypothetical protein